VKLEVVKVGRGPFLDKVLQRTDADRLEGVGDHLYRVGVDQHGRETHQHDQAQGTKAKARGLGGRDAIQGLTGQIAAHQHKGDDKAPMQVDP